MAAKKPNMARVAAFLAAARVCEIAWHTAADDTDTHYTRTHRAMCDLEATLTAADWQAIGAAHDAARAAYDAVIM